MDQKILRDREAKCIQEQPPGCTAGCPIHVDARGMIAAMRKGDYAAGGSLFHKAVPFPRIISRVCDQPCQTACKRKEVDEPISINALERVCVEHHHKPAAKISVPPLKDKKIAIVGAGLSGLTAALELARKGYPVAVFEATARLGGSLWDIPEEQMPRQLIEDDFAIFEQMPVDIYYNRAIGERGGSIMSFAELCKDFDAVYVGVGCEEAHSIDLGLALDDDGHIGIDPLTLATSHPKVFAGGSLRRGCKNRSAIFSISDGKIAAVSIDRLLQGASLTANRSKEGPFETTLYTSTKGVKTQSRVIGADPAGGYTKEEAAQEANRCLSCECMECVKACEYLAHYGSYPRRYAREVYNNLSIVQGIHRANKMINTCSLCGLCQHVCPGKLDMGEICHEARKRMVQKGKMPPSTHDFALRDMQFSNSHHFAMHRHQQGFTSSKVVFFPSCQLAASAPQHVQKVYEFLCAKIDGGVGLMLGCCGAPANWAGQEELFQETIRNIEHNWRDLGSPQVITACPSCFAMFKHAAPDMPVETLWTVLDRIGLPEGAGGAITPQKLAIHDSCTTRHEGQLQEGVRNMLSKLGHQLEELPGHHDNTTCCGYGGLMIYSNKEVAHKVISKRIQESETDYIAYCAMCRDNFASQGKRVYHILDLIFGQDQDNLAEQEPPGYSQRQENRAKLKTALLRDVWGENVEDRQADVNLIISESVRRDMEDAMILVDDVAKVVANAESTGNKLKNTETGHYLAYLQPLKVTYWVEYSPQDDGFIVHNAYSHRLEIT